MNSVLVRKLAVAGVCCFTVMLAHAAGPAPKGAKAIFDSGEGSSIAMSATAPRPARGEPVAEAMPQRYVGISYQILQLMDDGSMRPVSQARTFRNGERVKIVARTNRPGYLTVLNVGPIGNTNVLFNEYVEPYRSIDVPRSTNLRFVGEPGTERLLFMLSNDPNPVGGGKYQTASAAAAVPPANGYAPPPSAPPPSSYTSPPGSYSTPPTAYVPPPTGYASASPSTLPPPPPAMIASIDGAKSIKGSKDLVAEDRMQSSYTVISPRNAYRPKAAGTKDLVLESSQDGTNYGVLPVSAVADGGILTLDVSLRHR